MCKYCPLLTGHFVKMWANRSMRSEEFLVSRYDHFYPFRKSFFFLSDKPIHVLFLCSVRMSHLQNFWLLGEDSHELWVAKILKEWLWSV